MSQIMEKTLASLPKLLTQSFIGGKSSKPIHHGLPSQDVQNFMRCVHLARSKSHEATLVHAELSTIQQKLKQSDLLVSLGVVRNCFTKLIYCHILGYNVSSAAIYAINLAQQGQGYDKRLGYLLSCLILHPQHEMVMLMLATLIRDLKSSNLGNNCIALLIAGELVGEENIPSILPEVINKLRHSHDFVREKALHCLRSFYQRAPDLLQPYLHQLNSFLTSKDPGVLFSVVNFFYILCRENPRKYVDLGPSFLHILEQINQRGFGTNYYYHMVPLPWLQIALLKILQCLGSIDAQLCQAISPLLQTLIQKTKVTEPISLAVLVESVLTATQINASEELLNLCSVCIGKLLSSDASNSMKYQGLGLLISLSKVRPSFAAQHQMAVVECLMDEDPAIQVRTTLLLHAMANRANVKAVVARLFRQIQKSTDKLFSNDILLMISDLTEKLVVDIDLYLDTYFSILGLKLSSQTRDLFIDLVLSKMEKISMGSEKVSDDSLEKLTALLFDVLNKADSADSIVLLSLQLLGVLAPVIRETFSSTSFLHLAEQILSKLSVSDQKRMVVIKAPVETVEDSNDYQMDNQTNIHCCCLVTMSKLVLADCLQVDCVKDWLQKHNYRHLLKGPFVSSCLGELEELLEHPDDVFLRSKIMFHSDKTEIDTSLSFLDNLVVQSLLLGGTVLKPKYIKLLEQKALSSVNSPLHPVDFLESVSNASHASEIDNCKTPSSGSSKVSSGYWKTKTKWRDDDDEDGKEEQCSFIGKGNNEVDNKSKHEEIALELFAGMDHMNTSGTQLKSDIVQSNTQTITLQNIWDDDDDECSSKGSAYLNPFGIHKKPHSITQWQDEDVKNDNLSFIMDDKTGFGFISCKSEKAHSPSTPVLKQSNLEIFDKLDTAEQDIPLLSNVLYNSYPGASTESITTSQSTVPSIYSESFADLSSEMANSVSTIDALTDSDPDEAGS